MNDTRPNNFFWNVIVQSEAYNSSLKQNAVELLHPVIRRKVLAVISDLKSGGIQATIFETYRSQVRQERLFQQGVTKLQSVGVHHYGLAADIVFIVDGNLNWDVDYSPLFEAARNHNLITGHDWGHPELDHTFRDDDHVQWCSIADQQKLFNHTWYPDDDYNPYDNL